MFPLFSQSSSSDVISNLFHPAQIPFLVAIVAILVGGIMGLVKLFMRHRERMAMIERGIHPDFKDDQPPTAEN